MIIEAEAKRQRRRPHYQAPTVRTRIAGPSSRQDPEGKSPPPDSRAGAEGSGVLDRLEGGVLRIDVGPDRAGRGVGHRQIDLDVGEAAGENPEMSAEAAAIDDLDDGLDVGSVEEP